MTGSRRFAATYMRGGTSKGVFFLAENLPSDPAARDRVLLRVVGSPDPYGAQIDGMGGGTSSTSKVVVVSRSSRPGHDVDYLFGAVAIGEAVIDWSGNCGNLSAAVGPFAISKGLLNVPADGPVTVRIWQANISKSIHATIRMSGHQVVEAGDFTLDGVAFPAAPVDLVFSDPAGDGNAGGLFPTGNTVDDLHVPGLGMVRATLINAGNPAVFIRASSLGLTGMEMREDVNTNAVILEKAEALRAAGAVAMGLAPSLESARRDRPATPKLAFFAPPSSYRAADGRLIDAASIDVLARTFSMGRLHHAMTGTGAVGIAAAASVPGTLVHELVVGRSGEAVAFGHPSGIGRVAAHTTMDNGVWRIASVSLTRSARVLMDGFVHLPP